MAHPLKAYKEYGIQPENIPAILKQYGHWVIWRAGEPKPNGKFDKIPISIKSGNDVSAHKSCNWVSFESAYNAYESGKCDGIGIVLTDEPFTADDDGNSLYLVGVDLDGIIKKVSEAKSLRNHLGVYNEISPSLKGARMLGFSRKLITGGNAGDGRELYGSKRFLTITGISGNGDILDITDKLVALEKEWFSKEQKDNGNVVKLHSSSDALTEILAGRDWSETEGNIGAIREALSHISPKIPYSDWRDIIWSIASLEWDIGEELLTDWSKQSEEHWGDRSCVIEAQAALASILNNYDQNRGISIGTLWHHAEANGWANNASEAAEDAESDRDASRFKILSPSDLYSLPPMEWLVKGILPAKGIAAIYGAPGSGKTFLGLDLAITLSEGVPKWFSRATQPRNVVYLALEGAMGIGKRLKAWEIHNKQSAENLNLIIDSFNLKSPSDVVALVDVIQQQVGPECVVFIDTLNQASPGSDENSSVDMGLLLAATKAIYQALNGLVVLVHHSGKNTQNGLRGHSSMNGAMDTVILVQKTKQGGHKWSIDKSKDGDGSVCESFDLVSCNVGKDAAGLPETSCAVNPKGAVGLLARKPLSGNQKAVYEAIEVKTTADERLAYDDALEVAKSALGDIPSNNRADRARTALNGLISGDHLIQDEGGLSLPESPDHSP